MILCSSRQRHFCRCAPFGCGHILLNSCPIFNTINISVSTYKGKEEESEGTSDGPFGLEYWPKGFGKLREGDKCAR